MSQRFEANAVRAGIVYSSQPEAIRAAASIAANASPNVFAIERAEELLLVHDGNHFVGRSFFSQTLSSLGRFPRPAA